MSLRRRVRASLPYAVAVIGGFLVAYLIVAFVIFPSGVIPGNAKIPNVMGLTFDDATKRLAAVGFRSERGDERPHEASPKETVLDQDPRAGERDPEGTSVRLTVSAGPPP
ncbi:MAG TPA: PASTA domain-containing protein [Gemmatimonadaceae bacterium]|nr:PASTA domain-containing protein [Gemmatimonadaceae bacterium]